MLEGEASHIYGRNWSPIHPVSGAKTKLSETRAELAVIASVTSGVEFHLEDLPSIIECEAKFYGLPPHARRHWQGRHHQEIGSRRVDGSLTTTGAHPGGRAATGADASAHSASGAWTSTARASTVSSTPTAG